MLAELARAVDEDLATPDHAPATERAYAHDWDDFVGFCQLHGLEPLPAAPQTLALYLKALETRRSRSPRAARSVPTGLPDGVRALGLALPTLRRRLAAIASRHATAGLETPTDHPLVRKMLRRYARSRGTAVQKKDPLLVERLPSLMLAMGDDLPAQRDCALLLLGYAGAFRRSELVALDVEDLRFSAKGLYVWIAAAKNDPRKKGRDLYVPRLPTTNGLPGIGLCAVGALERWLETVGRLRSTPNRYRWHTDRLFRSYRTWTACSPPYSLRSVRRLRAQSGTNSTDSFEVTFKACPDESRKTSVSARKRGGHHRVILSWCHRSVRFNEAGELRSRESAAQTSVPLPRQKGGRARLPLGGVERFGHGRKAEQRRHCY